METWLEKLSDEEVIALYTDLKLDDLHSCDRHLVSYAEAVKEEFNKRALEIITIE